MESSMTLTVGSVLPCPLSCTRGSVARYQCLLAIRGTSTPTLEARLRLQAPAQRTTVEVWI